MPALGLKGYKRSMSACVIIGLALSAAVLGSRASRHHSTVWGSSQVAAIISPHFHLDSDVVGVSSVVGSIAADFWLLKCV